MKRVIVALTFLLATSSVAPAQNTPAGENLRGLPGVRLIVMCRNCPSRDLGKHMDGLGEAKRQEILKMVEADATAKLQEAGIPFYGLVDKRNISAAGNPKLIVWVRLSTLNSMSYPVEVELKLMQMVRLARDPSIEEYDAVSWSRKGVEQKLEISKIRLLVANLLDQFIKDYWSVNPKQPVSSGQNKPGETKH
jgi:hypothetical protein